MKKIIAAALSAAVAVSALTFVSVSAADYTDVSESDWFFEAVNAATEHSWFAGYEDNSFKPQNSITRAEAAKVLVSYKYGGVLPDAQNAYPDVSGAEWYAPFVNISGAEDIIPSGDEFLPAEPITREDTVVGMLKVLGIAPSDTAEGFTDDGEISDYAIGYVKAARKEGVIDGYDDGSFGPARPVTRAEFAQILMNGYSAVSVSPTSSPIPTATPSPSPEATATASPTETPAPTADPNATPTPSPSPVPITESFKEKSIYIMGDNMLGQNKGWLQPVKDDLAPESMTDKASGTYTFSTVNSNTYANALSSVPEGTDYLIIMGGRYEWENSRPIGDETSVVDSEFTGAFRSFINAAKLRLPDTSLIIVTPPNIANSKTGFTEGGIYNTRGLSIADYAERMRMICEETDTLMIDLNSECWSVSDMRNYLKEENMSMLVMNEDGISRVAELMTEHLIEINKK